MPAVPFKAYAMCRHHIPKQKRRLTNWPAYEASLRQRGDLTVWFSEEAIAAWRIEPWTIYRLVGAILLEQNDEWSVQRARYMTLETIATLSDDATVSLPAMAN
jgi:hypothetical protein